MIEFLNTRNKIIHGDFVEEIKNIADESIDLILTDIPYNVSRKTNFKTMKDRKNRIGMDFGEWDYDFNVKTMSCVLDKIKPKGSMVVFSSFEQYSLLLETFPTMIVKDRLIWNKTNPFPKNRDSRYMSDVELATWFTKTKKWTFNRQSDKFDSCVMRYPTESGGGFKRFHPTQKNTKMFEELIKRHSNEGELVLDICAGSGTTGMACRNTGRNYILIEKEKKYIDGMLKRGLE